MNRALPGWEFITIAFIGLLYCIPLAFASAMQIAYAIPIIGDLANFLLPGIAPSFWQVILTVGGLIATGLSLRMHEHYYPAPTKEEQLAAVFI